MFKTLECIISKQLIRYITANDIDADLQQSVLCIPTCIPVCILIRLHNIESSLIRLSNIR